MILLKKNRKKIENILADELKEENEMNMSRDEEKDESKFITEYVIQAVIRKKLLFNKRPRPIVS